MKYMLLGIVLVSLLACSESEALKTDNPAPDALATPASAIDVEGIVQGYLQYRRMTNEPVRVSAALSGLCRSLTPAEEATARGNRGPHSYRAIHIYMNDLAAETFEQSAKSYPVGSVIVKEKLAQDGKPGLSVNAETGIAGMIKQEPGYSPEHGDWAYFYVESPAAAVSGRLDSCIDCHGNAKANDYVFGDWARQ